MKTSVMAWAVALGLLAYGGMAGAAELATSVSATGAYNNSLGVLNDGVIPANWSNWSDPDKVWFTSSAPTFTFTFDAPQQVQSFLANVDNNDDYTITLYDGATQVLQRTILASDGYVGGGVETFTSAPSSYTYVPALSFAPVTATSATLTASGGDSMYGVGEVEFFGSAAVPEPATWAMMILGVAGAGLMRRRRNVAAVAA